MPDQIIRAPILNPRADGSVDFLRDGVIHADFIGRIAFVGEWEDVASCLGPAAQVTKIDNLICPPLLDNHIHIPQHPIRGKFMEGIAANPQGGRLLAGLMKNVFPVEAKCSDREYTQRVVLDFLQDTLSKGVIGGAAYMSVHAEATEIALQMLPETWRVGLVLMNQQPEYLRTDEANLERDIRRLAERFGRRFIVTDRFAIAVDSPLRQRASKLAKSLGLRMQTHLNEQRTEKRRVEQELYRDASSYTDVYRRDGLLEREAILAHCIHMREDEWKMVRDAGAVVAHCPTSNTLLGSGIMNLDELLSHGIDYAICTDVGASPTTSMLCEMAQFLKVHAGRSNRATPGEALFRSTLAPARMLGINDLGTFEVGQPLSFIEIACDSATLQSDSPDDVILKGILQTSREQLTANSRAFDQLKSEGLDLSPQLQDLTSDVQSTQRKLDEKVQRVVMNGATVYQRPA
jgi:guanine deaminase